MKTSQGSYKNLRSSLRRKHGKKKLQKYSCRHVPRRRRRRKLNTSVRRDLQVTFPREQTKIVRNLLRTASWTADPRVRLYETGTRQHSLENTCLIVYFTSTKKNKELASSSEEEEQQHQRNHHKINRCRLQETKGRKKVGHFSAITPETLLQPSASTKRP